MIIGSRQLDLPDEGREKLNFEIPALAPPCLVRPQPVTPLDASHRGTNNRQRAVPAGPGHGRLERVFVLVAKRQDETSLGPWLHCRTLRRDAAAALTLNASNFCTPTFAALFLPGPCGLKTMR